MRIFPKSCYYRQKLCYLQRIAGAISKILLLEKIYRKDAPILWHADYADKADSRGFFIISFLIRKNPCNPWIKVF